MSKIICDVCGTSYPETATQCPICGCVRPADSIAVSEENQEVAGYAYIKGGRFSKSNVKKRSQGSSPADNGENRPFNKKIIGLAIVLVCLVVIVALMLVFIISLPNGGSSNRNPSGSGTTDVSSQEKTETIPCSGLKLYQIEFTMTKIGEAVIIDAIPQPSDTTDAVKFESSDVKVVTVDEKTGKVICIGSGKADIKVSCGDFNAVCRVTCEIEPVPTDPSEPSVTVKLMRKKIDDANYEGKFFNLYNDEGSDVAAQDLTWISDDPKVAMVDQFGKVTAVGEGSTTIRVEYNGVTVATCEIVCNFTVPDNGEENPEGGDLGMGALVPYSHYGTALPFEKDRNAYSVTLNESKNEWVGLYLCDPSNPDNIVKVRWELDETYGGTCQIDEDGLGVTATSDEICRIVAKYGNSYYYIIIR